MFIFSGCQIGVCDCLCTYKSKKDGSLTGKWHLEQTYDSPEEGWQYVHSSDSFFYSFGIDNILLSDRFSCNGTTIQNSDTLTITFDCSEIQQQFKYLISIEKSSWLILTLISEECTENCMLKFYYQC